MKKNSKYGIKIINGEKIFFKKGNVQNQIDKILEMQKYGLEVPIIKSIEQNAIIYEYDNDLYTNTLYVALYFGSASWNLLENFFEKIEKKLLNEFQYCKFKNTNSYKNMVIPRINHIKNANKKFPLLIQKDFLNEIYLKELKIWYSNGDITDTNICLNGKICDSENAGYNSVDFDFAILFVSILFGCWIYPKYHSEAYEFRINVIKPKPRLIEKQKRVLRKIIKIINKYGDYENFSKFVIFRLVSPISLNKISKEDTLFIKKIIICINKSDTYNIIKNLNNLYSKTKF